MKNILFLLFFLPAQVFAVRHYVKVGGGGSGTLASPFSTVAQVNAHTFISDDTISFYCGDLWREALVIPNSGTSGHHIVFNSYGTGAKPKLYGSNVSTSWTDQGGNVWKSSTTFSLNPHSGGTFVSEIFFVDSSDSTTWGLYKSTTGSLTSEYDWTWSGNYIYVYAASNPGTRYSSVEVPQRNYVINVGSTNQYITIDGLDIRYATSINIDDRDPETSLSGFTLKNCHVSYVGSKWNASHGATGYNVAVLRNHLYIQNNVIHDGGRRNISVHVYDASGVSFSDFIIEGNILYSGYHATGFGIAMDGPQTNNHFSDIIIRNNYIYDDPNRVPATDGSDPVTQGHFECSESGGSISNVQVYNNIWAYPSYMGLELKGITGATVYNNTFYDQCHNANGYGYEEQLWISGGTSRSTNIVVKNNIFYNASGYTATHPNAVFIENAGGQLVSDVTLNYNLFYATDAAVKLVNIFSSNLYTSAQWAAMKSYTGWQANGPAIANPLFVSSSDYRLQANSPAIGAGANVGLSTDYAGNAFSNPPAIGAYDINSESIPVTSITVFGAGGATTISTPHGTLQLHTIVLPTNATDTAKVWSIADGTGHATISSSGLVTAVTDGTVTATATAHDGSNIYDDLQLTISNQDVIPFSIIKRNGKIVKYKGKIVIR